MIDKVHTAHARTNMRRRASKPNRPLGIEASKGGGGGVTVPVVG